MSSAASVRLEGTSGVVRRIQVGASFLTGVEVDIAASIIAGSNATSGKRLEQASAIPFRSTVGSQRRGDGTYYAIDGADHGTDVVPRTLATIDPTWLRQQCDDSGAPAGWRLVSAECDVHDFGVGMVVLEWGPDLDAAVDTSSMVDCLAEITVASRLAVAALCRQIASEVGTALADDPARINIARGLNVQDVAVLPPVGEVLWQWHVIAVSCDRDDLQVLTQDLAAAVCPNDFELMVHRDHAFAAAVHVSIATSVHGHEADSGHLMHAPRVQDAWWTLFWRLDRVLLALQLRLEAKLEVLSLDEMQVRAEILQEIATRVGLLQSRLDSLLVASGARDLRAWQVLGTAWDLPYRAGAVEKKISLLTQAYSDAVARIATSRTTRVNFMIYVFTAFSLVASVVAVAQFAQGSADTGAVVRLVTILASIAGALLAVAFSVRTTRAIQSRLGPG